MGVIIRQSFKSTIVLYIGAIIGLINRLFLLPNYLSLEQLGLVDVLMVIAMLLAKVSYFGTQGSITKFFSYFKDKGSLSTFSGFILLIPLIGYSIFSLLMILFDNYIIDFFKEDKELLTSYYYFIFPLAFFIIIKEIFTTYSVNNLRLTVPSILNETFTRLATLILLLLIGYNLINFYNYVFLTVIIHFITAILLVIYCIKTFNFSFNLSLKQISRSEYKDISVYSIFIFFAGLSAIISQYTDSIMLARLKGFNASAIYSVAFFIGLSIEMPKRAITSISTGLIAKHWNDNNKNAILKLYKQSSINQGVIGAFLLLLILVSIDEIFYLLPKRELLIAGKDVAIIIGLSRLIDMITGINNEILRTSKYYKIDFYVLIFFILLSITSNLILIPILGLNGAAYATLISVTLYNLVRYLLLKKLFGFEPFTFKTLKLFMLLGGLILINLFVPQVNINSIIESLITIALKSVFYGGLFLFFIYRFSISDEINNIINTILSKIYKK